MTRIFSSTKFWKVLILAKPCKRFPLSVVYVLLFALCWFASMLKTEYHWNIEIYKIDINIVFITYKMFA